MCPWLSGRWRGSTCLSYPQSCHPSVMKDMLARAGYDDPFAGHSSAMVWPHLLMSVVLILCSFALIQGDWNSDAWLLYTGLSVQQKQEIHAQHARGHHEALWSVLICTSIGVLRLCVEGELGL